MSAIMTPEVLKDACKKNGGYAQPTLNDQLYLQCRGFAKIENLSPYTKVKVLWLEQNAITDIEGLDDLAKLISLFLQNNTIRKIQNLTNLTNLRILNLSNNYISKIENLASSCPLLETLQLSHNYLPSLAACEELWGLHELSSVDLSFNKMERLPGDSDLCIVEFFAKMPTVSVIYLHGNGLSHGMKHYRKNMIVHLPSLTYLDERPVFPDERRSTEAWGRGGDEAESSEKLKIREEKKEELSSCVEKLAKAAEMNKEHRDKQNILWEARKAEEFEALKLKRQALKREQQQVDGDENDDRGTLEIEESDAWDDLQTALDKLYAHAVLATELSQRQHNQRLQVEAIQRQADLELRAQETEITAVLTSQPTEQAANSMKYWIKLLDQSDEQIVQSMEDDLEAFLSELQPGFKLPTTQLLKTLVAAGGEAASRQQAPVAALSTAPDHTSLAAVRQSAATKKAAKEKVWEQYYKWEKVHEH